MHWELGLPDLWDFSANIPDIVSLLYDCVALQQLAGLWMVNIFNTPLSEIKQPNICSVSFDTAWRIILLLTSSTVQKGQMCVVCNPS